MCLIRMEHFILIWTFWNYLVHYELKMIWHVLCDCRNQQLTQCNLISNHRYPYEKCASRNIYILQFFFLGIGAIKKKVKFNIYNIKKWDQTDHFIESEVSFLCFNRHTVYLAHSCNQWICPEIKINSGNFILSEYDYLNLSKKNLSVLICSFPHRSRSTHPLSHTNPQVNPALTLCKGKINLIWFKKKRRIP